MHILLLEPSSERAEKIKRSLVKVFYSVDIFSQPDAALTRLEREVSNYNLLVVNISAPSDSSADNYSRWCLAVRKVNPTIPIIALTNQLNVIDRVKILLDYADDVIQLPVTSIELIARIHAVNRRPKQITQSQTHFGHLTIDNRSRAAYFKEELLNLSRKEFLILEILAMHLSQIVTREKILGYVWEVPDAVSSNILDAHIKNVRKKIRPSMECRIKTIRGIGYQLLPE